MERQEYHVQWLVLFVPSVLLKQGTRKLNWKLLFQNISNKMQRYSISFIWKLL